MARFVALIRGINVGGNSRVPMATLRAIFEDAGCEWVVTVLNSGNVIFSAENAPDATSLEGRIMAETGVFTRVLVVAAARLRGIVKAMPYTGDESKLVITFMHSVPTSIERPDASELAPELLQIGPDAVYQWLPDGVSNSKLKPAFWKRMPSETTARNLRTAKKLLELVDAHDYNQL
jgi:uncharacterized protein (DUF1697 family)